MTVLIKESNTYWVSVLGNVGLPGRYLLGHAHVAQHGHPVGVGFLDEDRHLSGLRQKFRQLGGGGGGGHARDLDVAEEGKGDDPVRIHLVVGGEFVLVGVFQASPVFPVDADDQKVAWPDQDGGIGVGIGEFGGFGFLGFFTSWPPY